jgi:hypothetical protein
LRAERRDVNRSPVSGGGCFARLGDPLRLAESFPLRSHAGMGSKRLDKISDYHRHGFNLQVTCRGCGRVVVLDSLAMMVECVESKRSRDMSAVQRRLACSQCGGRDVRCGPIERRPGR